jgi:GNAT acetyltransferase-like protein
LTPGPEPVDAARMRALAYYERRGFVLAHRNIRWQTGGGGRRPAGLADLSSVPLDELLAYDGAVFGTERERFVRAWIDRPPGHALAYVLQGTLAGYGVIRPCGSGAKVGPPFADDEGVAEALLAGLLATAGPGTDVFIDIPEGNATPRSLRAARPMEASFETVRMYKRGRPPEDSPRVFGVTTFEFG